MALTLPRVKFEGRPAEQTMQCDAVWRLWLPQGQVHFIESGSGLATKNTTRPGTGTSVSGVQGVRQNRNLKKECVLKHDELFHEVTLPVNFPPSRPPPSPPHTIYCLQRLKDRSIQCSGLWSFENVKNRSREEISIHLAAVGFSLGARSQGHQRDRHT